MKKTVSMALCIVCVLTFSAFDWGKKSKSQQETTTTSGSTWQTAPVEKAASGKSDSKVKSKAPDQVPSSASDKAAAISTLAKIVGSGTPEERQARIESLKRVSQALAQSQAQNQPKKTR
jgi:hypothetical protein